MTATPCTHSDTATSSTIVGAEPSRVVAQVNPRPKRRTRTPHIGRRPGNQNTKEQILASARAQFAQHGYEGTTMRAIAEAAGVNVALVSHYFGSKAALFRQVQLLPETVKETLRAALHGPGSNPDSGTGERLTRAYLGIWEDESTRPQIMAIVRSALTSGHGMKTLRRFTSAALFDDERGLDSDQSLALSLALGNLLGIAVMRHITRIPGVYDLPFNELVARVSPAVQLELAQNLNESIDHDESTDHVMKRKQH